MFVRVITIQKLFGNWKLRVLVINSNNIITLEETELPIEEIRNSSPELGVLKPDTKFTRVTYSLENRIESIWAVTDLETLCRRMNRQKGILHG